MQFWRAKALYADPQCTELRKAAAAYYSLEPEQVFVDSGSDVILAYCMIAYNSCGEGFCFPDVTYNFYRTFNTKKYRYKKISAFVSKITVTAAAM